MLNRAKSVVTGVMDRAAETETKLEKKLEEIHLATVNKALAEQFPEWDLKPPATLIKRRSSRIL
ncbi:hypothetical protein [Paenibacillus sp. GCM10027626]|uniref:hypothetical protein n=1 Tax=Paenibacillus sp. GCM10027626 TaxID=3273411 RepID=UPI00363642A7